MSIRIRTFGPCYFLVVINDIVKSNPTLKINLFADDTSVYLSDENVCYLYSSMKVILDKIVNLILKGRITINVENQYNFYFQPKKKHAVPHQSHILSFNSVIEK